MSDVNKTIPLLPQNVTGKDAEERAFELSMARTQYNYMRTYLEGVPLSADVPKGEEFSGAYKLKVVKALIPLITNFGDVVKDLWEKELKDNWKDDDDDKGFLGCLVDGLKSKVADVYEDLSDAFIGVKKTHEDLERIIEGLQQVVEDCKEEGATAFLKSTLFYTLSSDHGGSYLEPNNITAYKDLFDSIDLPQMLDIGKQDWMVGDEEPCLQDWFFAHIQIAGFNTTLIQGVRLDNREAKDAAILSQLLAKFPLTDDILQSVVGDNTITLEQAAREKRLFVVDYAMLAGATANIVHGRQRYITPAIAVFYWNPVPPKGYPPGDGVLQPIAIQLDQQFDAEKTPIYTPNNCANANDDNLLKWRVAKFVINALCAMQHESVAHLGSCHLTIDPIVVCSHRQLSVDHPLARLFAPHFQFTIQINNSALNSLIVPRGVVATNVGPAIESTMQIIANARQAWHFDDNNPERLFKDRGVDTDAIPQFAFRDDTMLLWQAIKPFVSGYLKTYYQSDEDVVNDAELQNWVSELVKPTYAGFIGMEGLKLTGDDKAPAKIESLDYLIEMVCQVIYIAGPRHASVNYAQYPLMSYMPSVAGTIYAPMPTKSEVLNSEEDCLKWYPPLDVGLYTFSFEYLLSEVQFDQFGYYPKGTFIEPTVLRHIRDLQNQLGKIEETIKARNKTRAFAYVYQLPSKIPNSISI